MPTFRGFQPPALVNSFCGLLDIKSGAKIILLFGALNKVAGVYGLISAFTGGSISQMSFYIYSSVTLYVVVWGLRAVADESTHKCLKLAHLYALDHVVQTIYALRFARHQWYEIPHDGARSFNSQAQKDLVDLAISRHEIPAERPSNTAEIAHGLWEQEKGFTAFVLILAWLLKIYFIVVIYSYAAHLRTNTYHSLPLSSSSSKPTARSTTDQWASTAPAVPTKPGYRGSLDDGLSIDEALNTTGSSAGSGRPDKGKRRASAMQVNAQTEDVFKWDSDEEEGDSKQGKKSSDK